MPPSNITPSKKLSLTVVLVATGAVLTLAMGVRHGFGFWQQPIVQHYGWTRETFTQALAWQNLLWGAFGPLAGIAAQKWGTAKVMMLGAVLYALGLICMASVTHPWLFMMSTAVLIGGALACTTFAVVSGIISQVAPLEKRSWAFGVSSAASSFGQFLMMPIDQYLIQSQGWQIALWFLSGLIVIVMLPMAWRLHQPSSHANHATSHWHEQSIWEASKEAFSHKPFMLLLCGYFVCGFQLMFIGMNMPAYLTDKGILDPNVGVTALALIGLFNIIGSYAAGYLGGKLPKRYLLSAIYGLRSLAVVLFLLLPLSPVSVYIFSSAMGLLWLSTVPLTNGVIAGIFGVKHLSMLSGFVFFSHQMGSFLGAWFSGYFYAKNGNYNVVWGMVVVLGISASLINMLVSEKSLPRLRKYELIR